MAVFGGPIFPAKAYMRNRFLDAWARYCPDTAQPATSPMQKGAPVPPAKGLPPATAAGTLPVGPPGGAAGPKRAR